MEVMNQSTSAGTCNTQEEAAREKKTTKEEKKAPTSQC